MGVLINPGNDGFKRVVKSNYVDKTQIVKQINKSLETRNMLSCICLPPGFGRTTVAQTLTAYYDRSCDSHKLFDDKKIAESDDYETHLNQYNVLYLDLNYFAAAKADNGFYSFSDIVRNSLGVEIIGSDSPKRLERFMDVKDAVERSLVDVVERSGGKKFIVVVDGWDVALRHAYTDEDSFLDDLSLAVTWFNSDPFTSKAIAGVVMTGSLPFRSEVFPLDKLSPGAVGALPVFREYSLQQPGPFAEYFGFSEDDVKALAGKQSVEELTQMYGGYVTENAQTRYNPASTLRAVDEGRIAPFWREPHSSNAVADFIVAAPEIFDEPVAKLFDGEAIALDSLSLPSWYKGEIDASTTESEFFALMTYLGFLTYDSTTKTARIPNEEVKRALRLILEQAKRRRAARKSK